MITRRNVLKGIAVGFATVAIAACTPEQQSQFELNGDYTGKNPNLMADGTTATKSAADLEDEEDPPKYNCLTQGDAVCGYRYHSLPNNIRLQLLQDKLIDDTTACRIRWGNTSKIVCDNGLVTTS